MLTEDIGYKIENAKHLDFGQIFNESIELFKKIWVNGLVTILLMFAFIFGMGILITLPISFLSVLEGDNPHGLSRLGPIVFVLFLVVCFIAIAAFIVIALGFKVALFRIMYQKDMNMNVKEDYFYFLKPPYFKKTVAVSLAFAGINILAILLCYLPVFYVIVPLNLLMVVYAFNPDLSVSDLIKLSFDLGNKKWFITFGLMIVSGFLAQIVGVMLCFIGIFATASFTSVPLYIIYKKVVGFDTPEYTKIKGQLND